VNHFFNHLRADNHYDAAASWEGAQNSKPEDLPLHHNILLRVKSRDDNFKLIFSYLFPEAVT
jgi:hypothetical protein